MNTSVSTRCEACDLSFSILDTENKLLAKIAPTISGKTYTLPSPSLCPACREANRLAFRNEWKMYRRTCDATGKALISIYREDSPYKVIDQTVWWSDEYDPLSYGREFDFSRSFFEQFHELNLEVPKAAIQNTKSENSFYTNYSARNKNCYLVTGAFELEDCYYCSRVTYSKSICDSYDITRSELCYECIHGSNLYECLYSRNCHDCSHLILCTDCRGCSNCYKCSGLRSAKFCVENQEYTEKEYQERISAIRAQHSTQADFTAKIRPLTKGTNLLINCEDCSGDFLINCSRCHFVFSLKESQDCLYCGNGQNNCDSVDCNFADENELQYYSTNLHHNYRVLFCALVWFSNNGLYLINCFHCSNLFGCTGMKRNNFCILNKQYSESEYFKQVSKIIEHMKDTGEWGRFFPSSISPFPFNTSVAFEYYPLTREAALSKGLCWEDEIPSDPDTQSHNFGDARICIVSNKPFRCVKEELAFYEKLDLPIPDTCPEVRHRERMQQVQRAIKHYL